MLPQCYCSPITFETKPHVSRTAIKFTACKYILICNEANCYQQEELLFIPLIMEILGFFDLKGDLTSCTDSKVSSRGINVIDQAVPLRDFTHMSYDVHKGCSC